MRKLTASERARFDYLTKSPKGIASAKRSVHGALYGAGPSLPLVLGGAAVVLGALWLAAKH